MITKIERVRLDIPQSLLTCDEEPKPPSDLSDDRDVARWALDGFLAGRDCRAKLGSVRRLVEGDH